VPAAVVLSPVDYESLVATIELLRNPEARARLREYEDQNARRTLEFVADQEAQRLLFG
jgi:PHD/YefM family antitoxin component YafN of YafNO toxin-antitoxin module